MASQSLYSSTALTSLAADHLAMAGELEAQVAASRGSFERELAIAIERKKTPAKELFQKFQHGLANEQQIFKGEFRQFIKQQMKINTDVHKIDGLFERLDLDKGGSLDLEELTAAIDSMHQEEVAAERDDEETMYRAQGLRAMAVQLLTAVEKMVAVEQTQAKYAQTVLPGVDQRMGAVVLARLRKGDSVQTVSKEWDLNMNGTLSRYEFHRLVETTLHEPPSEALDAEVDRLFDRYAALEHVRAPDAADHTVELRVAAVVKVMMDTEAGRRTELEKLKREVEKKQKKAAKEQPSETVELAISEMAEAEQKRLAQIQAAKDAQIQAEKELEMKRQLGRSGVSSKTTQHH